MKQKMYSIYDVKAAAYGVPFFTPTDGLAIRSFQNLVEDSNSMVFRYPEDFTLYCLGDIDLNSALITADVTPRFVISASSIIAVADDGVPAEASRAH